MPTDSKSHTPITRVGGEIAHAGRGAADCGECRQAELFRSVLDQDALQRAAMHVEAARSFGNITAAQFENALDVLPADPRGRHRIFRWLDFFVVEGEQSRGDIVGIHRLCQIIDRAELHRIHRGRDIAVASENNGACLRAALFHRRNHIEAVAVPEPHINHRKCGGSLFNLEETIADRFSGRHSEVPAFHGTGEALQEQLVILDDQKRTLGRKRAGETA